MKSKMKFVRNVEKISILKYKKLMIFKFLLCIDNEVRAIKEC